MSKNITYTRFWNELMHGVYGPRQGGARIIIDAENAATGAGKTGLAVSLAHRMADFFGYELTEDDITLSGQEYIDRHREHPGREQPSVLILDELSGGGAADSRRAMSSSNVNLGRAWETMRKKRIITLTTLPHWSHGDRKLRQLSDWRLWCRERPIGYFEAYKVQATFDEGKILTRKTEDGRIRFPNVDEIGDDLYRNLTKQKDELLASAAFNADEVISEEEEDALDPDEAKREEKKETAQRMRDSGLSTYEVAEYVGRSQSWVAQNTQTTG
jgi:hypothetical protein